ncbi:peptidoglycan editing factor PgeF [Gracilibacillus sp. YIM 98692]|uniref:peptidoglycan editing factor PgeF n=1 Tax=Gracilibacillus sp. YIM 98692 TaxID=2663532 RepID=UPI0013D62AEE|nr:peptidoglycan editing factor PgeF [Gracilibacillus sp. YIM 98692]
MEPFYYKADKGILTIDRWERENHNVIAGFTSRHGGESQAPYNTFNLGYHVEDDRQAVEGNRSKLADKIQVPLNQWVMAEQVHGNRVQVVTKSECGKGIYTLEDAVGQTDGLITNEPEVLCTGLFADCVPLFFYSKKAQIVGLSHAGWRGTVGNIAQQTIQQLTKNGVPLHDLEVVIGPSICMDCYRVDDNVIRHIPEAFQDTYEQVKKDQYDLDLKRLNQYYLIKAGVPAANIYKTSYCTAHDSLFFSHRKEKGKTGRMLGFIGIFPSNK